MTCFQQLTEALVKLNKQRNKKGQVCSTCSNKGFIKSSVYLPESPFGIVACYSNDCSYLDRYYAELATRLSPILEGKDPVEVALNHGESIRSSESDALATWGKILHNVKVIDSEARTWPYQKPDVRPYPFLSDNLIKQIETLQKEHSEGKYKLATELGVVEFSTLEQANDLLSIIGKYNQSGVFELDQEGVIPFPIGERYFFEE